MQVLPVLDLLNGQVVRGVAGNRQEYRPVESVLTDVSEPPAVAEAIRSQFGLSEFYLADLDAILRGRPNLPILRSLAAAGFSLMVDAGIRRCADATAIFAVGAHQIVAGLETLEGPEDLALLVDRWGTERIVFSLDLKNGRPLGNRSRWADEGSLAIARRAVEAGCRHIIVLDLARVGTSEGISTLPLCREIRGVFPDVRLITGGGVRGADDLRRLKEWPVDAVLVASALHNGALDRASLAELNAAE